MHQEIYQAGDSTVLLPFIPYGDVTSPRVTSDMMVGDINDLVWEIGDQAQQMDSSARTVANPTANRRNQLISNNNTAFSTRGSTQVRETNRTVDRVLPSTPVPFFAAANGRIETSVLDRGAFFPFKILDFAMQQAIVNTPCSPFIKSAAAVGNTVSVSINLSEIEPYTLSRLYVPVLQIRIAAPVLNNIVSQPITFKITASTLNTTGFVFGPLTVSMYDLNKPLELTFAAWTTVQNKPRYVSMIMDGVSGITVDAIGVPSNAQLSVVLPGSTHSQVLGILKAGGGI